MTNIALQDRKMAKKNAMGSGQGRRRLDYTRSRPEGLGKHMGTWVNK